MGIRLVGAALNASWAGLSERARLVLLHMAYVAKDTPSNGHRAATYWAGQEPLLITVLGLDPDRLTPAELATATRKIKRAVQELKQAGAISMLATASRGRTAVYGVHPDRFPPPSLPVDKSPSPEPMPADWGSPDAPHSDHPAPPINPEWGSPRGLNGGHPAPPRGEQLGEQEVRGEIQEPTQPATQLSGPAR